jgi:hypothetical protein
MRISVIWSPMDKDVDVWRYTNGQRRFDANMPLLQRQREALWVNAVSTHGVDAVALEATLAGFNSRGAML